MIMSSESLSSSQGMWITLSELILAGRKLDELGGFDQNPTKFHVFYHPPNSTPAKISSNKVLFIWFIFHYLI